MCLQKIWHWVLSEIFYLNVVSLFFVCLLYHLQKCHFLPFYRIYKFTFYNFEKIRLPKLCIRKKRNISVLLIIKVYELRPFLCRFFRIWFQIVFSFVIGMIVIERMMNDGKLKVNRDVVMLQ